MSTLTSVIEEAKKANKLDSIVEKVLEKFKERSIRGQTKYNTTLKDNNKDNYLQHLQEELMDAALYLEKLKDQKTEILDLMSKWPNDSDLGKAIRDLYGK